MNEKNATEMLIKRFGANKKDIPLFVNGATQDGMGYLQIHEYDKKNFKKEYKGTVIVKNPTYAKEYSNQYGKQKAKVFKF